MRNRIIRLALLALIWLLVATSGCSPKATTSSFGTITPSSPPSTQTSQPVITSSSTPISVPPARLDIKIQGDIPGGNDAAIQEFNKVYPYMVYYLGEPFTIGKTGVTWIWDPTITEPGQIGWDAQNNSVKVGPRPGIFNTAEGWGLPTYWNVYQQYDHETAHLFYNTGDTPINFTFGQWIWEAHALVGQALAYAQVYRDGMIGASIPSYDNISNIGWDQLNGVKTDGDKYNRTIVDSTATTALRLMTEVFAGSSGQEDFIRRVNAAIFEEYKSTNDPNITADEYKAILNQVAGNQTIDGLPAGDWFFSQPVANVSGAKGTYLIAYPHYGTSPNPSVLAPNSFDLAAFIRQDGQNPGDLHEIGLANQTINLTVLDSTGKAVKQFTAQTQQDGTASVNTDTNNLPQGAYIVQAKTIYNGNEITGNNFFIVQSQNQTPITANDNRMFIVPLNADGSAIRDDLVSKLKIEGGQVDSSMPGILVITAQPGKEITITCGSYQKIVSKPLTARIVPIRVSD